LLAIDAGQDSTSASSAAHLTQLKRSESTRLPSTLPKNKTPTHHQTFISSKGLRWSLTWF